MAVANRERVKNVGVVVKERWEKAMTHGNNLQKWADEALVYNSLVAGTGEACSHRAEPGRLQSARAVLRF